MNDAVVLDASVVLAVLYEEPLGDFDARRIPGSFISAVNFSEVVTKLIADGMPAPEAGDAAAQLDFRIHPFDHQAALDAAALWKKTKPAGLSFGDRACIALGLALSATIFTADRAWASLKLGPRLVVIR